MRSTSAAAARALRAALPRLAARAGLVVLAVQGAAARAARAQEVGARAAEAGALAARAPLDGPLWSVVVPALLFAVALGATAALYRRFAGQETPED